MYMCECVCICVCVCCVCVCVCVCPATIVQLKCDTVLMFAILNECNFHLYSIFKELQSCKSVIVCR